jgi:predicted RNA-binding protein with RPS1 domain
LPFSGRRDARAVPLLHSIHKGTVVSKRPFGVFVRLGDGKTYGEGLLHASKISADIKYRDGDSMKFVFFLKSLEVGDVIYAKVIEHRGRDKYNLDMRFVSQADGTDNDPDNVQENTVYKTVRHAVHPRKRFDDHTHHVPDATQEPADRTIETFRSGHEGLRTTSMQCSFGLRNCNNLLLRCSQAPLQHFDAVVARWFAAPATDASITANNLKSLIWSYLRNPKSLWMAMGTKIVACSLQTGTTTLIFDIATAKRSELRALVKGPALATVMYPGVCGHSNPSENRWFCHFHAPSELMWSVYEQEAYSAPKVVAQRVSKGVRLQKTGNSIRFQAGRVARAPDFGWAAFVRKTTASIKVCDVRTGESCEEPCDIGQAFSHLAACGKVLVYSQSGQFGRGSTIKIMRVQLAPLSLITLSSQPFSGPIFSLALEDNHLAIARGERGAMLFDICPDNGLGDKPILLLDGPYRDVALAHQFLVTLADDPRATLINGLVQVWSIEEPVRCVWRSQDASLSAIGIRPCSDVLEVEDMQEFLHDECIQKVYGNDPDEEPAAEITPEQAAQIQDALWGTGIEALAARGCSSSAASEQQEQVDASIVLLAFSRRPAELHKVIIESDFASALLGRGIDLKPDWAGGAIVLVEGLQPDDLQDEYGRWNVAVRECDEHYIHDALKKLPYNIRPRLKPGVGRQYVPGPAELFCASEIDDNSMQISEAEDEENSLSGEQTIDPCGELNGEEIYYARTFLHVRVKPVASMRSAPSTA